MGDARADLDRFEGGRSDHANFPVGMGQPAGDEAGEFAFLVEQIAGEHEDGFFAQRGGEDVEGAIVEPCALAGGGGVHLVAGDVEDDAEDGLAFVEEADADGEVSELADEVVGAVDGVDDPDAAVGVGGVEGDFEACLAFFADDAVGGESAAQGGDDEALAGAVGVGDGLGLCGGVGLGETFDFAVVVENDFARAAGEIDGELEVVLEGHWWGEDTARGDGRVGGRESDEAT